MTEEMKKKLKFDKLENEIPGLPLGDKDVSRETPIEHEKTPIEREIPVEKTPQDAGEIIEKAKDNLDKGKARRRQSRKRVRQQAIPEINPAIPVITASIMAVENAILSLVKSDFVYNQTEHKIISEAWNAYLTEKIQINLTPGQALLMVHGSVLLTKVSQVEKEDMKKAGNGVKRLFAKIFRKRKGE